jgi:hypothetical protein
MNMISNFKWDLNSTKVMWLFDGDAIVKSYKHPIRSAVPLADLTGVAIVEAVEDAGNNNAMIWNYDGSERLRIQFPLRDQYGYFFDQMYYVNNRLCVFANLGTIDFRYEIDESSGKILASFESR